MASCAVHDACVFRGVVGTSPEQSRSVADRRGNKKTVFVARQKTPSKRFRFRGKLLSSLSVAHPEHAASVRPRDDRAATPHTILLRNLRRTAVVCASTRGAAGEESRGESSSPSDLKSTRSSSKSFEEVPSGDRAPAQCHQPSASTPGDGCGPESATAPSLKLGHKGTLRHTAAGRCKLILV